MHFLIEDYGKGNSFLHRLDPRAKIAALLVCLLTVSSLSQVSILLVIAVLTGSAMTFAGITPGKIALRLAVAVPFMGFLLVLPFVIPGEAACSPLYLGLSKAGLQIALVSGSRMVASLLLVSAVVTTTRFHVLLQALRALRAPEIVVDVMAFAFRYFHVLIDEITRMRRARACRGFVPRSIFRPSDLWALAELTGMAFIRAIERSERVYRAMKARGYHRRASFVSLPPMRAYDYVFVLLAGLAALLIIAVDRGMLL